ncbi:hypothetical protein JHK86_012330 [Glycine max]|nr:hypothetical protein JHK86_012330 [Glycine max]
MKGRRHKYGFNNNKREKAEKKRVVDDETGDKHQLDEVLRMPCTCQEQDLEDTKRSSIGTTKQKEEEIERKTEEDRDTSNNSVSNNLHKNKNPPSKLEV